MGITNLISNIFLFLCIFNKYFLSLWHEIAPVVRFLIEFSRPQSLRLICSFFVISCCQLYNDWPGSVYWPQLVYLFVFLLNDQTHLKFRVYIALTKLDVFRLDDGGSTSISYSRDSPSWRFDTSYRWSMNASLQMFYSSLTRAYRCLPPLLLNANLLRIKIIYIQQ